MDKKTNKYLSKYFHCSGFGQSRQMCRELVRVNGRALQTLHNSAVEYAKTLSPEERKLALKTLRRRYNNTVNMLKRDKKEVKECHRLFDKYRDKKLLINSGSGGKSREVVIKYPVGTRLLVKYPDGRESSLSTYVFKEIEVIEE